MTRRETIYSLQASRAAAAISVLFYHFCLLSKDYASSIFYQPWTSILKSGVDVFFVISGVIMVITTYKRFDESGSPIRFVIHRLTRIYPAYWVLTALLIGYWLRNPAGVNSTSGGVDILASFTLMPSNKLPLVPVAWTLTYELSFYAVFFILLAGVKRKNLTVALVGWAAIVIAVGQTLRLGHIPYGPLVKVLTEPLVLEFIGGCLIGLVYKTGRMPLARWAAFFGAGLFLAIAMFLQACDIPDKFDGTLRVIMYAPPSMLLIYGLIGIEQSGSMQNIPRILVRMGDASYSIYLTHILVIHAAYRFVGSRSGYESPAFLAAALGLPIVIGFTYYFIVETPLTNFTKRLLERRIISAKTV